MGEGGGEGDTTLLNNLGSTQIKNSKSIPRRYKNLALSAWNKFILSSIKGTKRRGRYSPLKMKKLLYKKKIKITGVLVKNNKYNKNHP